MKLATSAIDLERKMEEALAARLKQQSKLARKRIRRNSEDSPKVNQDLIVAAKRGEGNPPFSGIYNLEITLTFSMRHRKTVDTLPEFLATCAAIEEVLSVHTYTLALQISRCGSGFYCYEIAVTGKDDAPEDYKHKCVWTLSAIAMPLTYDDAVALQTN